MKRNEIIHVRLNADEAEIVRLTSIYTRLSISTIVRACMFKRGLSPGQRTKLRNTLRKNDHSATMAFIRSIANDLLQEIAKPCQDK